MRRLVKHSSSSTGSASATSSANSSVLVGAGSTFVAPLVAQWEADYLKSPAAVTITYGAVGSGGGVDAITARSVDFGASDAPLTSDQATACKGCLQIPWALGATAIDYNVKGAPNNLKLTGAVLADIFLGNIKTWNDPAIKSLNPGVNLPATHITPIYRSDGSGTSFVLTDYLSSVDAGVGVQGRHFDPADVPDRHRRGAQLGRDRSDAGDRRRDHLCGDLVHRRG